MAKGMKGTSHEQMMPHMRTYGGQESPGYHPPTGSAGKGAKGMYGHEKNPMSVPYKGSQIGVEYGNADRHKAFENKDKQMKKENLRGQAC